MMVRRVTRQVLYSMIGVLVLMNALPSRAWAQGDHSHDLAPQQQNLTTEQKRQANALVNAVRDATWRFQSSKTAEAEYYSLQFGCVSGSDLGAMGLHFVNMSLLGDDDFKLETPEILLYEALPNGRLRLTGADYVVFADAWNANPLHTGPPQLMGQLFHLFDSPNRFGLPAFYTLHVWAWKDNPNGVFVNWHPQVSCDSFAGQNH